MCVALYIPEDVARPSPEDFLKMERANPHGAGVGWYDAEAGVCRWAKGLTAQQVSDLLATIPGVAALVHFRWASAGGQDKGLTHPFPIGYPPRDDDEGQPDWQWDMALTGTAREIMIHNGHWGAWETWKPKRLPKGPWSDTRLAAYLADVEPQVLAQLGGKVATMNAHRVELRGSWEQEGGVYYSNKSWKYSTGRCGIGYSSSDDEDWKDWWKNRSGTTGGTNIYYDDKDACPHGYFFHCPVHKCELPKKKQADPQDFVAQRERREARAATEPGDTIRKAEPVGVGGEGPFVVTYEGPYGYARASVETTEEVDRLMALSDDEFLTEMLGLDDFTMSDEADASAPSDRDQPAIGFESFAADHAEVQRALAGEPDTGGEGG